MTITKIWLFTVMVLTIVVTFKVYDDDIRLFGDDCAILFDSNSDSTSLNNCKSYFENRYKLEKEPKLDYVSSVDILNLSLSKFPNPCDIGGGVTNAEGWNRCVDSLKSGNVSLLDTIINKIPYSKSEYDLTGISVDSDSCKFINGKMPEMFSYDKKKRIVFCGNSHQDKELIVDSNKLLEMGISYNNSHQVYTPPFGKSLLYIDYNKDGYMDVAVGYRGITCSGRYCGGSGVIFLTKKSADGKLERVLPDCEDYDGTYDGAFKNLCSSN